MLLTKFSAKVRTNRVIFDVRLFPCGPEAAIRDFLPSRTDSRIHGFVCRFLNTPSINILAYDLKWRTRLIPDCQKTNSLWTCSVYVLPLLIFLWTQDFGGKFLRRSSQNQRDYARDMDKINANSKDWHRLGVKLNVVKAANCLWSNQGRTRFVLTGDNAGVWFGRWRQILCDHGESRSFGAANTRASFYHWPITDRLALESTK